MSDIERSSPVSINVAHTESNITMVVDVTSQCISPIILEWNYNRVPEISPLKWRRQQLIRYLNRYPDHPPRRIFVWLNSLNPRPWPALTLNHLGKLVRSIKVSKPVHYTSDTCTLSLSGRSSIISVQPLQFQWDYNRPQRFSITEWRKIQLTNYIRRFPNETPKKVWRCLQEHDPKP